MEDAKDRLFVTEAESGQKLLQFLQRRLGLAQAMLHRWIRTGQIRLNGRRIRPFDRLRTGDEVRLPPFAQSMSAQLDSRGKSPAAPLDSPGAGLPDETRLPPPPPELGRDGDIWIFNKPAGLPAQSGTGHADSVAARLASHYSALPFRPLPAHRLDRDTSGILLVAASYSALRCLQDALRDGRVAKEYLAWVEGRWPHADDRLLVHWLRKQADPGRNGRVRMLVVGSGAAYARQAMCVVRPLEAGSGRSLLQVRLLTGRTHQIRAQLAAAGHPLAGDGKYGRPGGAPMLLHALRVGLPDGRVFSCPPPWPVPFLPGALEISPEIAALIAAEGNDKLGREAGEKI